MEGTLSAQDIVRSSVLDLFASQAGAPQPSTVLLTIGLGIVIGAIIALVYRKTFRGVLYSSNFAITLIMLTLITTSVVMCIKSDLALSMGMVGALSIVRFRTAIKDPMDIAYMFWALTMGILLGAGIYVMALIVVVAIALVQVVLSYVKFSGLNAYLLVLHYDEAVVDEINKLLRQVKHQRLRSKTVTQSGAEMTVEIRLNERQDIIGHMLNIEGVYDATLVACQNEVSN